MSLAERDKAGPPPRGSTGIPCSIGTLLAALPDDEGAVLRRWLGDPDWSSQAIWDELVAEGHQVGRQTVQRHRRGLCRCKP